MIFDSKILTGVQVQHCVVNQGEKTKEILLKLFIKKVKLDMTILSDG